MEGSIEGSKKGFIKGSKKGAKGKQYEIAKNLLKNTNTSLKDISDCTGLSLDVINKLSKTIKCNDL
ncbi:MAG: hypothetical protein HFE04_02945 [Bacilli bacterium]|nr:hypothetical protein [Bacilli bacterium]